MISNIVTKRFAQTILGMVAIGAVLNPVHFPNSSLTSKHRFTKIDILTPDEWLAEFRGPQPLKWKPSELPVKFDSAVQLASRTT